MLSPVIQPASGESRNLTNDAMSQGIPNLFTPIPSAALSYPFFHKAELNLVLIRPGHTQLTRISSSCNSLAKSLVNATRAVLVMAQCPIKGGRSYAVQLERMVIALSFCFLRQGKAYCVRKKVALKLMSHIFWICSSFAYRKLPICVETAALRTKQSNLPYLSMVYLTSFARSSILPTWQTIPNASSPLSVISLTVQSMCFLSLLEMMTLTPSCASRIAIPFPIPVEEAVMMATLPFIQYLSIIRHYV